MVPEAGTTLYSFDEECYEYDGQKLGAWHTPHYSRRRLPNEYHWKIADPETKYPWSEATQWAAIGDPLPLQFGKTVNIYIPWSTLKDGRKYRMVMSGKIFYDINGNSVLPRGYPCPNGWCFPNTPSPDTLTAAEIGKYNNEHGFGFAKTLDQLWVEDRRHALQNPEPNVACFKVQKPQHISTLSHPAPPFGNLIHII